MNETFPCTSCGECCKKIGALLAVKDIPDPVTKLLIDAFPYKAQWQNGWCEKLTEDNKCSVYNDRPLLCNIREVAALRGIPWQIHYLQSATICNQWINDNPDLDNDEYLVFFEEKMT